MFCPKCGKELADGVRFCSACGTPLGGAPSGDNGGFVEAKSQNRKIGIIVVAAIAVVVIALIILIVKLVGGNSYEKPLDHLIHGIQNEDAKELMKAVPEAFWETSYVDSDKEEMIDIIQERLEDLLDGSKIKLTYKVLEEEEMTNRKIRALTKELQGYGLDIEEIDAAYALRVQVNLESDDEDALDIQDIKDFLFSNGSVRDSSLKGSATVAKIDGEWCLVGGLLMPWG